MQTKVFQSGNSIAVRIPKSIGLELGQVFEIKRVNQILVLTPAAQKWGDLFSAVESFKGELKREQPNPQEREW